MKLLHLAIVAGLLIAVIFQIEPAIYFAVCFLLGIQLGTAIIDLIKR